MTATETHSEAAKQTSHAAIDVLQKRLNDALKGKSDVLRQVIICLLAQGHLLLEDKPGLGKTTLARTLATSIGGEFSRVQCTPDLLPGDITGFSIYNQKTSEFEFRQGPVFADVMLADEINRATPRTQSALLEAMAERQVTVDGQHFRLSPRFFVIATQNPIDQHGTYPLPEAQLDRFAMKLSIGYPNPADEIAMLQSDARESEELQRQVKPCLTLDELQHLQRTVQGIHVASSVQDYLVRIATATRSHPEIPLGLSPRGLLLLQRAAQSCAFLKHRTFVTPDDVLDVLSPVLSVRMGMDSVRTGVVVDEVVDSVPLPRQEQMK
jgi:MoxR-like ATPase